MRGMVWEFFLSLIFCFDLLHACSLITYRHTHHSSSSLLPLPNTQPLYQLLSLLQFGYVFRFRISLLPILLSLIPIAFLP